MFIGNFHIKPHDKAHDKIYGFSKVHDKISKPRDRNSVMTPLNLTLAPLPLPTLLIRISTFELFGFSEMSTPAYRQASPTEIDPFPKSV